MTNELDELHHDVGMPAMWAGVSNMIDSMRGERPDPADQSSDLPHGCRRRGGRRRALLAVGAAPGLAGAASTEPRLQLPTRRVPACRPTRVTWPWPRSRPAWRTWRLRLQGRPRRRDCRQARHGAPGRGHVRHHGQGPAHAARCGLERRAQVERQGEVTVTNPTLTPTVQSDFAKVTDITGLAQLALTLETIAAQTYQAGDLHAEEHVCIGLSSSIQPVEMQHIAILYYVLGDVPRGPDECRIADCLQLDAIGGLVNAYSLEIRSGRPDSFRRPAPGRLWRRVASKSGSSATASSSSSGTSITISNFMFQPMSLTVAPGSDDQGDQQGLGHAHLTATGGQFNTGDITQNETKTFKAPTKPGTYQYICNIHQYMMGSIVVK
jgi:plastocyanin